MPKHLSRVLPVLFLCAGVLAAAEGRKDKRSDNKNDRNTPPRGTQAQGGKNNKNAEGTEARIVKVDKDNGTITLRMKDSDGKNVEKTFQLTQDVRMVDETGKVVAIDVFEAGDTALVIEREGRLGELRRPARAHRGRPSDLINALIEMTDCDAECTGEVQRAYDILRRLDKNRDGHIDADELKAARQQLVQERVDHVFKKLDKDQDGKISRDEARGMIKRDFDRIDQNKDEFIDREELLKAASERHDLKRPAAERR